MKRILIAAAALLVLFSCEKENYGPSENQDAANESADQAMVSKKLLRKTARVVGRYFWRLEFSIDNSTNTAPVSRTIKIQTRKKIETKSFLREKFNVKTVFDYENKSSISLKLDAASLGGESKYAFHIELAKEMEKQYEKLTTYEEIREVEEKFTVGAGGKLDLYRLVYVSDAGLYETSTIATSPKEDVFVTVDFSLTENVVGIEDMLDLLSETRPGKDNRAEWTTIRNSIVRYSHLGSQQRLYYLVRTLRTITPGRDNKVEWAAIRTTCNEILANWNSVDKNDLFRKLLYRFKVTSPGKDNRAEWAAIRDKANKILSQTNLIY